MTEYPNGPLDVHCANDSVSPPSLAWFVMSLVARFLVALFIVHKLSSMSKAVRCCVNCIALDDADESSATPRATNNDEDGGDGEITITKQVGSSKEQISWLAERGEDYCVSSQILATCMVMEEYTVFGIIRCKTSIAKCEGAKEAVHNIGEQYGQTESEVVVKENIDILSKKDCGCAKK